MRQLTSSRHGTSEMISWRMMALTLLKTSAPAGTQVSDNIDRAQLSTLLRLVTLAGVMLTFKRIVNWFLTLIFVNML